MRQTVMAPSPFRVRTGAVSASHAASGQGHAPRVGPRVPPAPPRPAPGPPRPTPRPASHHCGLHRALRRRALDPGGPESPKPVVLRFGIVQGREAMGTGWPVSEGGVAHIKRGRVRVIRWFRHAFLRLSAVHWSHRHGQLVGLIGVDQDRGSHRTTRARSPSRGPRQNECQ